MFGLFLDVIGGVAALAARKANEVPPDNHGSRMPVAVAAFA